MIITEKFFLHIFRTTTNLYSLRYECLKDISKLALCWHDFTRLNVIFCLNVFCLSWRRLKNVLRWRTEIQLPIMSKNVIFMQFVRVCSDYVFNEWRHICVFLFLITPPLSISFLLKDFLDLWFLVFWLRLCKTVSGFLLLCVLLYVVLLLLWWCFTCRHWDNICDGLLLVNIDAFFGFFSQLGNYNWG